MSDASSGRPIQSRGLATVAQSPGTKWYRRGSFRECKVDAGSNVSFRMAPFNGNVWQHRGYADGTLSVCVLKRISALAGSVLYV